MSKVAVMGTFTSQAGKAEESMQNHGQSEAMHTAMLAFGPLVAGTPKMAVTTPIAAFGLDL